MRTAPFEPSSPGESTIVAPYSSSRARRSGVAFDGITHVRWWPFSFATSASEIPVLPLVGSSSSCPGSRCASSTILSATRSLTEPVGFWPSSLAQIVRPGGERRWSSTSGVSPIRSSRLLASTAAGHGRKQDDRAGFAHRCVEPVARAHVLAVDVDVHERPDLAFVVDPRAERREPRGEVLEELADGRAGRLDLARAACLRTKNGRDPDDAHRWQNS